MKIIALLLSIALMSCSLLGNPRPTMPEECRTADTAAGMDKAFAAGFALTSLGLGIKAPSRNHNMAYGSMFTFVLATIHLTSAIVGSDIAEECWRDVQPHDNLPSDNQEE